MSFPRHCQYITSQAQKEAFFLEHEEKDRLLDQQAAKIEKLEDKLARKAEDALEKEDSFTKELADLQVTLEERKLEMARVIEEEIREVKSNLERQAKEAYTL